MYPKMKYTKVPHGLSDESDEPMPRFLRAQGHGSARTCTLISILACSLLVSNAITWFCVAKLLSNKGAESATGVRKPPNLEDVGEMADFHSTYAGLTYDSKQLLESHTAWTDANDTLRDQLWLDIDVDDGMIALDDTDVARWGLPEGQRFPWDDSKSIYLLQGHHNLHCARSIYISLMEYREGLPQSRRHHHIIHCLDSLRRDVLCNADDTPRHTTSDPAHAGETGFEQYRKCRNWDTFNSWAKQHNACFRYDHEAEGSAYPEIQRFVWCPEGSPYRKEVDKYFVVDYDTPRGHGII